LASLLAPENTRIEFEELESEITDLISELLEQEESEEAANN
jgi:ribosome biogenesis protein Nip4